ncbi:hypothetical protein SBA4_4730005 [Candidatus Sulfopaludibacter sp. SbA4]|nr:hypothetical protein SBA4_4730005 [Candidatus Sulfopaludibacter sp. SbA4]
MQQIVGIEEVGPLKYCGRDGLGVRMQEALLAEGTAFGGLRFLYRLILFLPRNWQC